MTSTQVHRIFIKAAPEAIWEAITKPEFTRRYFFGSMRLSLDRRSPGRRGGTGIGSQPQIRDHLAFALSPTFGGRTCQPCHLAHRAPGRRPLLSHRDP